MDGGLKKFLMTYIYALVDPRNNLAFYVGKTKDLKSRFYHHWSPSNHKHRISCTARVIELRELGIKPDMIELDIVPDNTSEEAEDFYISYFKYIGCPILNKNPSRGTLGLKRPEVAQKLRGKRRSKETIAKLSFPKPHQNVPVVCVDTGVVYASASVAANELGLRQNKIAEVCSGSNKNRKTHGGYSWKYLEERI